MIGIHSGVVFTGFVITSGNTEHSPYVLNIAPKCVLGIKSFTISSSLWRASAESFSAFKVGNCFSCLGTIQTCKSVERCSSGQGADFTAH